MLLTQFWSHAKVPTVLHRSPFGARGERPVFFAVQLPWPQIRELTSVPGIARAPGGLACTWDIAPMLAAYLGQPCPAPPTEENLSDEALKAETAALPGLDHYRRLELPAKLRPYQKEGALFLARRSYAMQCDPMRSGKSAMALAASVLVGARRTLVICPALAKYVWAEEVAKWTKEEALILEGRAGDFAKRYCRACDARGRTKREDDDAATTHCAACKMRNGQANGYKAFDTYVWEWDAQGNLQSECPKHELLLSWKCQGDYLPCPACIDELHTAIEAAHFVVCNYDILVAQKNADATGKLHVQENLQGWAPVLASHKFELGILDEAHMIRGFSTDSSRKGQTRRERVGEVTENFDAVWALTGTPIFGFTRDLWGPLDTISKGALTGTTQTDRLPFSFHARYCEGMKDDYGWKADGRSIHADTELKARLPMFKIQRPRNLILSQMPPKVRQVVRVDAGDVGSKKPRGSNDEAKLVALLKKTFDAKVDFVTENVISELGEGNKCVVFVYLRESAEKMGKAIEAACKKNDVKSRMREVDTKIWTVHGDTSPQGRFEMARSFREHPKAGVFVATIDSVQVAVSLKGATSVHFADLHWQPAALLQAEDRPYEVGTTGLSILYYIVRGSVDEHIEAIVLPKVKTLAEVVDEKGADELRNALAHGAGKENLAQIIKAMMKGVDTSLGAYDDGEP